MGAGRVAVKDLQKERVDGGDGVKDALPPADALGVAELETYIAELRGEIARAEQEIARKQGHRAAADSVFRRP